MKLKQRILQFTAFSGFLVLTACGSGGQQKSQDHESENTGNEPMAVHLQDKNPTDMHTVHNNLADDFAHKDIVILDDPYELSVITKAEMEQVVNTYLQLKDALFKEDLKAADKAIGLMANKVALVVPTNLDGAGLEAWQNHQSLYETKLKEMIHLQGLENKRSYFSHISEIMYCTIKSFGLKQGSLFAIYCPKVFNGKGAYWISDSKVVQNPYTGAKLPACGEIKEEL